MYLHIGKGYILEKKYIVGIFDLDITSQSIITRNFLNSSDKKGCVINAAEDIPKSYIIYDKNNKRKIYLSQMSTATLLKRNESENL